jgi:hypothetical protein
MLQLVDSICNHPENFIEPGTYPETLLAKATKSLYSLSMFLRNTPSRTNSPTPHAHINSIHTTQLRTPQLRTPRVATHRTSRIQHHAHAQTHTTPRTRHHAHARAHDNRTNAHDTTHTTPRTRTRTRQPHTHTRNAHTHTPTTHMYTTQITYHVRYAAQHPRDLTLMLLNPFIVFTAKKYEPKKTSALDNLLLDGFDQEQIWEQLQLLNIPIIQHVDKQIKLMVKTSAGNAENGAKQIKVRPLLSFYIFYLLIV